jgi:endonuclease YncB( thermonuclease family)
MKPDKGFVHSASNTMKQMNACAFQHQLGQTLRLGLLAILFVASDALATKDFTALVTYVSDGDTLWVQPDKGGPARKLRLEGIDAPEICQPGGDASRARLAQRVLKQRVRVSIRRSDVYGRALARIGLAGEDVGAGMVRSGQAWSYRWRRDVGPYAAEEALARQSRLGLFAAAQPEIPRDFRRRHGPCQAASR